MVARRKEEFKGKISKILESKDKLTGRGGLSFVSRYQRYSYRCWKMNLEYSGKKEAGWNGITLSLKTSGAHGTDQEE